MDQTLEGFALGMGEPNLGLSTKIALIENVTRSLPMMQLSMTYLMS